MNLKPLKKSTKKEKCQVLLLCDINLSDVDWEEFSSPNNIEQLFLDLFNNFELEQIVKTSTHILLRKYFGLGSC